MIKIVAKMAVKENEEEKFQALARELVEKSAAEAGNVSYSLNISMTTARQYAIIECWKDRDAVEAHNKSAHFTSILPQIRVLCEDSSIELFREISF